MDSVVLVIHLFLALAIIGLVLIQRSEGGGLGMGGGGLGGLASQRGTANILTRATGICAACFFCTSLLLAVLAGQNSTARSSILDSLDQTPPAQVQPVSTETPGKTSTSPEIPALAPEKDKPVVNVKPPTANDNADKPKAPSAPIAR